ncbi:flagellar hook-length control protein FliK [Devosia neptuniae]|uniref:Flagellar hook-length control protein FliK n=1 Tax=Devosia neptuniae TaxID=191302 RepID=A0ABY6CBF7_9HYPH|nr:flagellar hook-length control protein FliK [Devosia neptuniae]UXN69571.1 flagellar hook-length control protein FliK [Devosia neptuniae]
MPISSQFPTLVAAARNSALEALALQPGQVIAAKVLGPAPNGGTQVQIGDQMLNLVLPIPTKPGMVLQLEVQGSGSQQRLALQPLPAPVQPGTIPAAPLPVQVSIPLPTIAVPTTLPPTTLPAVSVPIAPVAAAPIPAPTLPGSAPQAAPPPAFVPPQGAVPLAPVATTTPQQPAVVAQPQGQVPPSLVSPPAVANLLPISSPTPTIQQAPTTLVAPAVPAPAIAPVTAKPTPQPAISSPATNAPIPASPAPQPPTTPQAALAQMVQTSAQRQGSVAALTAAVTAIAGKVALPEPVARAAQQVLAGRLSLNAPLNGATLQKAVLSSGIFQESALAAGRVPDQTDMKSALLTLRQTLTNWLGQQAAPIAAAMMAPPVRGGVLRARSAHEPSGIDPAATSEEAGKMLLERTDAALSRMRLHQHASLPDPTGKPGGDWSLDLPVLIGNHQTLLQMQIHRDGKGNAEQDGERGWQMRFALNLPALGEVGAHVSLRGEATGVMLWASEPETAVMLESELPQLRGALAATGLQPGAIIVRRGEPSAAPAPSGHFLDAQT